MLHRKYLPLLALLTLLSACSSLPTALQTCSRVVADAAAANNVLVQTTTVAVSSGLITAAQAAKVLALSDSANAAIVTANALCAAGNAVTAKTQATTAVTSVKAMTTCVSAPKPGSTLDACALVVPKPK